MVFEFVKVAKVVDSHAVGDEASVTRPPLTPSQYC